MEWQTIHNAPIDGTHILLSYYKGRKGKPGRSVSGVYIVTEGYYKHGSWQPGWYDGLGRLLQDVSAKKSTNKVVYWMSLPKLPEEKE